MLSLILVTRTVAVSVSYLSLDLRNLRILVSRVLTEAISPFIKSYLVASGLYIYNQYIYIWLILLSLNTHP